MMMDRQVTIPGSATSVVASSKLFSNVFTLLPKDGGCESLCPSDELSIISRSLDAYCTTKQNHLQWRKLLQQENPQMTEIPAWNSFVAPILGFKLYMVLSGSAAVEGKIPRSVMSHELTQCLVRIAKGITEKDGWPSIFADAIIARWNTKPVNTTAVAVHVEEPSQQNVSQKVAASVVQNLGHLKDTFRSKYMANIINNIQLAASYLAIMTLGVIDIPLDNDFPVKLQESLRNAGSQSEDQFSDILKILNLSLVEFQAPLFCCLAISPILLFRTCQLQSSRFGRQYYLSFMMSLGDIKPASLRAIETVIWTNLYLVARCQLSAVEMMNNVLDSVVEPTVLDAFHFDKMKFRSFFKDKFDPILDHTGFFFPASGAIIKHEGNVSHSASSSSGVYSLHPANTQIHSSPLVPQSDSSSQSFQASVTEASMITSSPQRPIDRFPNNSSTLFLGSEPNNFLDTDRCTDDEGGISEFSLCGSLYGRLNDDLYSNGVDDMSLDLMFSRFVPLLFPPPSPAHNLGEMSVDLPPPQTSSEFSSASSSSPTAIAPSSPDPLGKTSLMLDYDDKDNGNSRVDVPSLEECVQLSSSLSSSSTAHGSSTPDPPDNLAPSLTLGSELEDNDDGAVRSPTPESHPPSPLTPLRSITPVPHKSTPVRMHKSQNPDPRLVIRLSPLKRPENPSESDTVPPKRVKLSDGKNKQGVARRGEDSDDVEMDVDVDVTNSGVFSPPQMVKSSERRSTRIRRPVADREVVDDDSDEDSVMESVHGDDSTIPRLEVYGDRERIESNVIHIYAADEKMYYGYRGKHYNSDIADDLQKLAIHVDHVRMKNGLPVGKPKECFDGLTSPVVITPPGPPRRRSPIYAMNYSDFLKTSAKDFQDIFRAHPAIVISGRPTRLKCDLESLEEWGGVDELRIMHDNSRYDPAKHDALFVQASYREFLQTSRNVNSLDNPLSGGVPAPVQVATDLRAAVSAYDDFPTHIPVRIMTWGLLAKAHAVHPTHTDRPGTGTWIAVEEGLKKWDLGFPPEETAESEIANPAAYGAEMVSRRNISRGWQWHSILLHPGTMLLMHPGTVHSVTTLQDSIALGGHFFSAPTIKLSIYSIYHSFVGCSTITNVTVDNEQQMLLRIILFWYKRMCGEGSDYLQTLGHDSIPHLPNLLNFEDFLNFATLMNYGELVLVLTPSRYSSPCPVSFQQSLYQLPRLRSRDMRAWLKEHFELVLDPPVDDGQEDHARLEAMMVKFLLGQAHTLWEAVKRRQELGVVGAKSSKGGEEKEIKASQVLRAIGEDLSNFLGLGVWEEELLNPAPALYSWPIPPKGTQYRLRRKSCSN